MIIDSEKARITIGNRTTVGSESKIISADEIYIGDDVLISFGVTIWDSDGHSILWEKRKDDVENAFANLKSNVGRNIDWGEVKSEKITINNRAWIGFGATILKGVTIGEGAVVGAKSVITKDVPPYSVVAGNPGRVIRSIK